MLDVKQRFKSPRGTATAGEICRSGAYYAATASRNLAGKKTMNVHFSIMLQKWADVLASLCLLLRGPEYRCFVVRTADIKARFWQRPLK